MALPGLKLSFGGASAETPQPAPAEAKDKAEGENEIYRAAKGAKKAKTPKS